MFQSALSMSLVRLRRVSKPTATALDGSSRRDRLLQPDGELSHPHFQRQARELTVFLR